MAPAGGRYGTNRARAAANHLYDTERSLPASILQERIERDLEQLRNRGEDWPQTAQAYVTRWLVYGYLERRFPAGSKEEEYELATSTIEAIRYVAGLVRPHNAATESRLGLVIGALAKLSDDTDANKGRRVARLRAKRNGSRARSPLSSTVRFRCCQKTRRWNVRAKSSHWPTSSPTISGACATSSNN